jgi:hypothetical protein
MQAKFATLIDPASSASYQACWDEHLGAIPEWTARVARVAKGSKKPSLFNRYWEKQETLDAEPFAG